MKWIEEHISIIAQLVISLLFLTIFAAVLAWLMQPTRVIDNSVKEPLMLVLGTLLGIVSSVAGFWLGTSLSSAKKDAMLASKSLAP